MKINDIELEFDIFDADFTEKYEKVLASIVNQAPFDKNKSLAESIRIKTNEFRCCLDELFGEGIGIKLIPKDNLRLAINTVTEVISAINASAKQEINTLNEAKKKYAVKQPTLNKI